MSAEDRLAILEQIARYSYAADERDADGLAALFTDEGIIERWLIGSEAPDEQVQGTAALRSWAQGHYDARPEGVQTRHHERATVFDELANNGARTRTMLLLTRIGPGDRFPVTTGSGVYHDEWLRTTKTCTPRWFFSIMVVSLSLVLIILRIQD